MTRLGFSKLVLSSLVLSLVATVSTAEALPGQEIACRDAIAKTSAKYEKLAFSTVQRCHQARGSGNRSLSVNCNNVSEADTRGKLTKARVKAHDKIAAACAGAEALLDQYPACPAPASTLDDSPPTDGIDDFDEVTTCVLALVDAGVSAAALDSMGNPGERLLDAVIKCQVSIGRGAGGLMRAYLGERRKCQRSADAEAGSAEFTCDSADPNGKIAAAQVELGDLVFEACDYIPEEHLAKLGACAETSAGLADCAQASADEHGADLIENAYVLPTPVPTTTTTTTTTTMAAACGATFPTCGGTCASGTFCEDTGGQCECVAPTGACEPATIYRHLNARYGDPAGDSQLSTGWTGKTHIVDVPDDSFDAIDVTCDSNCENCQVSLNPRVNDPTSNCRCAANPRTPCTAIAGADATHCGGVNPTCNCYFGPALAISSGGTPVCVLNQLREDYSGTMDLRTGNYSDVIKLASLVHLGISQFAPCPTCDGDTTPYDGQRHGTCNGGLQNGQTCDVNGVHRSFGPVSFDCPPASASNISGSGLQIDLEFQSGTQSLTAALPCDSSIVPGALCPCRVCTGNSQLGCTSNADCAAAGAGDCTEGGNVPIEPNDCADGVCTDGLCEAGPVDQFCDGAMHADGRGFVSCTTNADCFALNAGTCSILDLRRCFNDPIVVSGEPSLDNPVNGAIFCIPATTNDPVNLTAGLPGPGTANLEFDAEVRCQSDPDLVYDFPSGANCPATTTTTTTTTTTLPLPSCGSATFPVCGGTCPGLLVCAPTLVNTCVCTSTP